MDILNIVLLQHHFSKSLEELETSVPSLFCQKQERKTNDRIDSHYSSHPIISAICASMDEDIYVFSNSIILFSPFYLFYFSTIFKLKANFFKAFSYTCLVPFGTYTTLPSDGKYAAPFLFGGIFD